MPEPDLAATCLRKWMYTRVLRRRHSYNVTHSASDKWRLPCGGGQSEASRHLAALRPKPSLDLIVVTVCNGMLTCRPSSAAINSGKSLIASLALGEAKGLRHSDLCWMTQPGVELLEVVHMDRPNGETRLSYARMAGHTVVALPPSTKSSSSATSAPTPKCEPLSRAKPSATCVWPPPTNGRTRRRGMRAKQRNGTGWCSIAGCPRRPTCALRCALHKQVNFDRFRRQGKARAGETRSQALNFAHVQCRIRQPSSGFGTSAGTISRAFPPCPCEYSLACLHQVTGASAFAFTSAFSMSLAALVAIIRLKSAVAARKSRGIDRSPSR